MQLADAILTELVHEMAIIRRLLERAPDAEFAWAPHEKSMTLGRLATHIAEIPGWVGRIVTMPGFDLGGEQTPRTAPATAEVLAMFDAGVFLMIETLTPLSDETLLENWRLTKRGQPVLEMSRIGMVRMLLLNHLIHHRGQLSVYLRLCNVPLPSIYGPSADQPM